MIFELNIDNNIEPFNNFNYYQTQTHFSFYKRVKGMFKKLLDLVMVIKDLRL